jgi:hypothetical protein
MANGLGQTFWDFSMQLCDLQIERLSDFPTLDAVESFAEFRDYSAAVVRLRSGLWADGLVFLTHSDDPIGHLPSVTEQFARCRGCESSGRTTLLIGRQF